MNNTFKTRYFKLLFFTLTSLGLCAQISLPPFFSDHMVLQQEQKIVLFGKAAPNEKLQESLKVKYVKQVLIQTVHGDLFLVHQKLEGHTSLKSLQIIQLNSIMYLLAKYGFVLGSQTWVGRYTNQKMVLEKLNKAYIIVSSYLM